MDAKRARIADLQDAQDHPPVVSFIMPMRNAEAFLAETLASVVAQTYTGAMELCVYDDGSTDASSSILEVRLLPVATLNLMVAGASREPWRVLPGWLTTRRKYRNGGRRLKDETCSWWCARRSPMHLLEAVGRDETWQWPPAAAISCASWTRTT
jgi:cellulose synthase/poly-beta-1,6-N-acetylglucosamine synthase-like glycosyltransferase